MQGTWNHERAHHRCRYPAEYTLANDIDHPGSAYLREELGELDRRLARHRDALDACTEPALIAR